MSDPEDRSMPTVCMRTNYKEIRKEVPERYVLIFDMEDEGRFVSYDTDANLGLGGSFNFTNDPIPRMEIPKDPPSWMATAFCGLLLNRHGIALAKRSYLRGNTGREWKVYALIDNVMDLKEVFPDLIKQIMQLEEANDLLDERAN